MPGTMMRLLGICAVALSLLKGSFGFVERSTLRSWASNAPRQRVSVSGRPFREASSRNMMDPLQISEPLLSIQSTGLVLAETDPWVQPLASILDPILNILSFAMVRTLLRGISVGLTSGQAQLTQRKCLLLKALSRCLVMVSNHESQ